MASCMARMASGDVGAEEYQTHRDASRATEAATEALHVLGTMAALLAAFPATIAQILAHYPAWIWGAADASEFALSLQQWAVYKPAGFLAMGWCNVLAWAWAVPAGAVALAAAYWATVGQVAGLRPPAQHGAGQQSGGGSGGLAVGISSPVLGSGAQYGAPGTQHGPSWSHVMSVGIIAPFWEEVLFRRLPVRCPGHPPAHLGRYRHLLLLVHAGPPWPARISLVCALQRRRHVRRLHAHRLPGARHPAACAAQSARRVLPAAPPRIGLGLRPAFCPGAVIHMRLPAFLSPFSFSYFC